MRDLDTVADIALSHHDREKLSATDAVAKAIHGRGLNAEQVHRISTKVNRNLLKRSKAQAGNLGFPERWETAKPTQLLKQSSPAPSKEENPVADTTDIVGSMGSPSSASSSETDMDASLDYQLKTLRQTARSVRGQHSGGTLLDQPEGEKEEVRKDLLEERPETSGPVTPAEVTAMSQLPPEVTTKGSATMEQLAKRYADRLRRSLGVPVEQPTVKKSSRDALSDARILRLEYHKALQRAELELTKASAERRVAGVELQEAIENTRKEGFTLGEALHITKLAFALPGQSRSDIVNRAYSRVFATAAEAAGVDLDAALGEVRDQRGNLKVSEIKRAQSEFIVRAPVANARLADLNHPLVKASAAFLAAEHDFHVQQAAVSNIKARLQDASTRLAEVMG